MDAVKINRRQSKVFGCFKAVDFDDEPPCALKSPPSVPGDESGRRRKKSSHRKLAVAVKAVLSIKTILAKKLQTENPKKVFQRSNSQKLFKFTKKSSPFSDPTVISRTNSDSSSSSSSSSSTLSSSFGSSNSLSSESSIPIKRSVSLPINHQKSIKKEINGGKCSIRYHTVDLCVLLVCLVSLVFYGKVFAIVTSTSMWLFFGPRAAGGGRRRFQSFGSPENELFESPECKKRVVMEGTLSFSARR